MRTILSAILLFLCVALSTRAAAPLQLSKPQIEAAYLYNFARFVQWPDSAFANQQAPLVIGVFGADPFGNLLDDLVTGEKVRGRSLVIRRFARMQDLGDCHILFIPRSEAGYATQICEILKNRHVLTVSDIPGFVRFGGIIELVEEKERIRFRIALSRARGESLEISAKLLRPAEVVSRELRPSPLPRNVPRWIARDEPASLAARFFPALEKLSHISLPPELSVFTFIQ